MEQNTVNISLSEYKEFIIAQYENGNLKLTLIEDIKRLKGEKADLEMGIKEDERIRNGILSMLYREDQMTSESDTRKEMTEIVNSKGNQVGRYFGFSPSILTQLIKIGFKLEGIVKYINDRWDEYEASKTVEEEQA